MSVRLKIVIILSCLWPTLSCAADNYGVSPAARAVVEELVEEEGFDRQELMRVFAQAQRKDSILEAIARPAEKTKPWYQYREIFLNEKREQTGGGVLQPTPRDSASGGARVRCSGGNYCRHYWSRNLLRAGCWQLPGT